VPFQRQASVEPEALLQKIKNKAMGRRAKKHTQMLTHKQIHAFKQTDHSSSASTLIVFCSYAA